MQILGKKRNTRDGESLFVFQFVDSDDLNEYVDGLTNAINRANISEDIKTEFLKIVKKIQSRADNKYGNSEFQLSAALFADEMAYFTEIMSVTFSLLF